MDKSFFLFSPLTLPTHMGQLMDEALELPAGATPPPTEKVDLLQKLQEKEKRKEEEKQAKIKKIAARFWKEYLKRLNDPNYFGTMKIRICTRTESVNIGHRYSWEKCLLKYAPESLDTSNIEVMVSDEFASGFFYSTTYYNGEVIPKDSRRFIYQH